MKVKISKTGEIKAVNHGQVLVHFSDGTTKAYKSISDICDDLEDYKDTINSYWFMNDLNGKPMNCDLRYCGKDDFKIWIEQRKQIGNCFETKEEAEKVVEKLKAWKRLKDKGFRFDGWTIDDGSRISICSNTDEDDIYDGDKRRIKPDLDLLFGGEDAKD